MLVLYPLMPSSQLIDSSLMYTIFQLILGLPIALIISRKQNQMTHKITQMTSEITQMTSEITQMTCDKKNHEDLQRKYESEKVYPILEDLDWTLSNISNNFYELGGLTENLNDGHDSDIDPDGMTMLRIDELHNEINASIATLSTCRTKFQLITLFSRSTMYIDDLIILENILKKNIDAIRIAKSCDDVQFESIYDEHVESFHKICLKK